MPVDQVHVEGAGWVLQAHLLWNRESSLHGSHTQSGLCQQVCVLLEVRIAGSVGDEGCGPSIIIGICWSLALCFLLCLY